MSDRIDLGWVEVMLLCLVFNSCTTAGNIGTAVEVLESKCTVDSYPPAE